MFDRDAVMAHARAMREAAAMTGMICTADEEQAASEAFMAWAQSLGLRGRFLRTIADDGRVVWVLKLDAGRGKYEVTTEDPRCWYSAAAHLGLPMDTVSADWVSWKK